jgi:hypothetical protein
MAGHPPVSPDVGRGFPGLSLSPWALIRRISGMVSVVRKRPPVHLFSVTVHGICASVFDVSPSVTYILSEC